MSTRRSRCGQRLDVTSDLRGRLAWLDELRTVAIIIMIVDHALLFFLQDNAIAELLRSTITRCAEPLFIFVLTSIAIQASRPMRVSRWLQIAAASLATSTLLSMSLGYFVADVLASIAIGAPLLPLLFRLTERQCIGILYFTAALSPLPLSIGGISFDYSPVLIVYQMLLTRLSTREGGLKHVLWSGLVVLVAAFVGTAFGVPLSAILLVVCFGHPLAAIAVFAVQRQPSSQRTRSTRLAAHPLKIYVGHVFLFTLLIRAAENV